MAAVPLVAAKHQRNSHSKRRSKFEISPNLCRHILPVDLIRFSSWLPSSKRDANHVALEWMTAIEQEIQIGDMPVRMLRREGG